ncbi:MAG: hypothetical protein CL748_05300, partial [Chloroflexi bacterium]|nr:hypothetical protein [Chloroflexota bacterium]
MKSKIGEVTEISVSGEKWNHGRAGDIRAIFTKCGGNLAETGSVSFLFKKVGLIEFDKSICPEDDIIE